MKTSFAWRPQPGPQTDLYYCTADEIFFGGQLGGGKSDGLLGKVGGLCCKYDRYKAAVVRKTYVELEELIERSHQMYRQLGASWHGTNKQWTFRNGSVIRFRQLERDTDVYKFQGKQFHFIGVDEIGLFNSMKPIDYIKTRIRSVDGSPTFFVATGNPGGPLHNALKSTYIDPAPPNTIFEVDGVKKIFIPSALTDNKMLMESDPDYARRILSSDLPDYLKKAFLEGDWNIVAGGMFDDVWHEPTHYIDPFDIPHSWTIDRAFDWGSSKPFAVGWFAESNGERIADGRSWPRGTIFHIAEWYGYTGRPNEGLRMPIREIALGIKKREDELGIAGRVQAGPADSSIWAQENGPSFADEFAQNGVFFTPADKRPGSRIAGWQRIRDMLVAARKSPVENPALYIFKPCVEWRRTVPTLPRDARKPDDVQTEAEDHCGDMTRYRALQHASQKTNQIKIGGF